MTASFDDFAELVRARRTHMLVDRERTVPSELVDRLCELGTWAPNHKRTWPWRFVHVSGESRCRLGEAFADDMAASGVGDEARRAKTRVKYCRTPSVLAVAAARHHDPRLDDDNRYAVAACVQNILLGATAVGLASFWSSPPVEEHPAALRWCGLESTDRFVALVYLGWPVGTVPTPPRSTPDLRHRS